ncbi:hypothetical protein [Peredibacter starrii]|uniref:Superoxide dismutase copper/zinc binding domain-containing protein n=1 Tax=Peredibacter starrii TaxID=28202 RepID=A0AAX4HTU8_9BACT|nr:hypothetical protein [Peredibacter starrii]WPU66406.1 hypothetical protein SOO65_06575 [Peredibacter starrii]
MKQNISSILFLSLTLLAACGKSGGKSNSGKSSNGLATIKEQQAQGNYRAILRPFNNHLSGFLPSGFAEINIAGDTVSFKTMLDDDARVIHLQSVHAGTRCPNAGDDINGDSYVDIKEAYAVVGKVLVPLDSDLNSTAGFYPLGGGYTYIEAASLKTLETDVKSRTGEKLNLTGRVVLLHGVNPATELPDSFGTLDGMTPQASAPIACGVIFKK